MPASSARPGDRPNHGVTQFVMADCRATPAFDEIVVTTFTAGPGTPTLPIWIHNNLFRPNLAPVVNVVAVVLVLASHLPVRLAQRIGGADAAGSRF